MSGHGMGEVNVLRVEMPSTPRHSTGTPEGSPDLRGGRGSNRGGGLYSEPPGTPGEYTRVAWTDPLSQGSQNSPSRLFSPPGQRQSQAQPQARSQSQTREQPQERPRPWAQAQGAGSVQATALDGPGSGRPLVRRDSLDLTEPEVGSDLLAAGGVPQATGAGREAGAGADEQITGASSPGLEEWEGQGGSEGAGAGEEAFLEFLARAEEGHGTSQYAVAVCYRGGLGVAPDRRAAAFWFRRAAEQGLARAQHALGGCYETGSGVEKDEREAFLWYARAVRNACTAAGGAGTGMPRGSLGSSTAGKEGGESAWKFLAKLACCYERGVGVPVSHVAAASLFRRAHEHAVAAQPRAPQQKVLQLQERERLALEDAMRLRRQAVAAGCPEKYLCGLTAEILSDPAMLVESGQVYERVAIHLFLAILDTNCPVTDAVSEG